MISQLIKWSTDTTCAHRREASALLERAFRNAADRRGVLEAAAAQRPEAFQRLQRSLLATDDERELSESLRVQSALFPLYETSDATRLVEYLETVELERRFDRELEPDLHRSVVLLTSRCVDAMIRLDQPLPPDSSLLTSCLTVWTSVLKTYDPARECSLVDAVSGSLTHVFLHSGGYFWRFASRTPGLQAKLLELVETETRLERLASFVCLYDAFLIASREEGEEEESLDPSHARVLKRAYRALWELPEDVSYETVFRLVGPVTSAMHARPSWFDPDAFFLSEPLSSGARHPARLLTSSDAYVRYLMLTLVRTLTCLRRPDAQEIVERFAESAAWRASLLPALTRTLRDAPSDPNATLILYQLLARVPLSSADRARVSEMLESATGEGDAHGLGWLCRNVLTYGKTLNDGVVTDAAYRALQTRVRASAAYPRFEYAMDELDRVLYAPGSQKEWRTHFALATPCLRRMLSPEVEEETALFALRTLKGLLDSLEGSAYPIERENVARWIEGSSRSEELREAAKRTLASLDALASRISSGGA